MFINKNNYFRLWATCAPQIPFTMTADFFQVNYIFFVLVQEEIYNLLFCEAQSTVSMALSWGPTIP